MSIRAAALISGVGLALMATLAPIGVFVLLPVNPGAAALVILIVAGLDVAVGAALWPVLRSGGEMLAMISVAMRIAYAAVFAAAAGSLADGDVERFRSTWDAGLLMFGAHLFLAGVAMMRSASMPSWIGVLLMFSGLGYAFDSIVTLVVPDVDVEVGTFTFIGEVVLIVWLLGWAGRPRPVRS